jgi:hypothetical protein
MVVGVWDPVTLRIPEKGPLLGFGLRGKPENACIVPRGDWIPWVTIDVSGLRQISMAGTMGARIAMFPLVHLRSIK